MEQYLIVVIVMVMIGVSVGCNSNSSGPCCCFGGEDVQFGVTNATYCHRYHHHQN